MKKTNAVRTLDKMKILYELSEYDVDENDLGAENVAKKIGRPLEQVFKTLVATGDRTGILIACLPGSAELDLKSLAVVSGNKKVAMVPMKEIQNLTGYIRGGVSPIGMKKKYPVFIDETALKFEDISISAGQRGLQLIINPGVLMTVTEAKVTSLVAK